MARDYAAGGLDDAELEVLPRALTPRILSPRLGVYPVVKRAIDFVVALVALVFAAPVMLAIAVAIKADSPGPVIFSQVRVGKGGRPFTIYKFRSMVSVAPAYSLKVRNDDPRVTRVGRFLRLSGLDELPQILNVVRGEMSLIGPRPELEFIVDMYEPWQRQRHLVTPGITGWWQIHHRNEVPMHHGIAFDLFYIENLSSKLDLQIALRTVAAVFAGARKALVGADEADESEAQSEGPGRGASR
jgi:lipopolysaccharide/colanic/teichoic acid biosynthesis glycosyltransferase